VTPSAARSLAWAAAAAWCLLALAAAGVALLAIPAGVALDVRVHDALAQRTSAALAWRADAIARTVDPPLYAVWVTLLCAVALLRARVREAVAVAVVAVGSGLTAQLLKAVLAHPRGADGMAVVDVDPASWPSGHTTAAAALALCAVLAAPAGLRPLVALAGGAAAASIGAATVIAGWHMPSDALGGALVAGAWAAGAAAMLSARSSGLRPAHHPRPPRHAPPRAAAGHGASA
jgi:membrane-associated phospholipid phosphatase